MPMVSCLQNCPRWRTCIADRLCCRSRAERPQRQEEMSQTKKPSEISTGGGAPSRVDPTAPGMEGTSQSSVGDIPSTSGMEGTSQSIVGDIPSTSADLTMLEKVKMSEASMENLEKLLSVVEELCERLQPEGSSIGDLVLSQWNELENYVNAGKSIMDSCPENLKAEVKDVGKKIVLPLCQEVLERIGDLHWITAAFSLVAWSLNTMVISKNNSDGFIKLLRKAIRVLKSTRNLWTSSTQDEVEVLQDSFFKALKCAALCSQIMLRKPIWYRFLAASEIQEEISNLDKELENAAQENSLFATERMYMERPKPPVQPKLTSNQEMAGENDVKQKVIVRLNEECRDVVAVCLHGMGGIGKTTLGKSVFAEFQELKGALTCIFSELPLGATRENLLEMQKDIVEKVCRREVKFKSLTDGVEHLKEELKKKEAPVFLYLDNVLEEAHLSLLLPEASCFPKCSRILVTTRNEGNVRSGIKKLKIEHCSSIELKKLDKRLAKELLWKKIDKKCKLEAPALALETEVLKLCDGLPLALSVVGGYINEHEPSDPEIWQSVSDAMRNAESLYGGAEDELYSRLQFSINGLNSEMKGTFLDIITFLVDWPWATAERIVNRLRLENLQNRALVQRREELDRYGETVVTVGVHDVLKTIGLRMAKGDKNEIRVISQDGLDNVIRTNALERVVGLQSVTVEAKQFQNMPDLRVLERVKVKGECRDAQLKRLSFVDMNSDTSWPFHVGACTALKQLNWRVSGGECELDWQVLLKHRILTLCTTLPPEMDNLIRHITWTQKFLHPPQRNSSLCYGMVV